MTTRDRIAEALDRMGADLRPTTLVNRDRAQVALNAIDDSPDVVLVELPEPNGDMDSDGQIYFGDIRVDLSRADSGPGELHLVWEQNADLVEVRTYAERLLAAVICAERGRVSPTT